MEQSARPQPQAVMDGSGIDWDDALTNADYIPDGMKYPDRWVERAAAFRATARGQQDVPYGDHPRERLDLFLPDTPSKGLVVFVHGGYWRAFDKSSWSDLATGPLALGWTVALPSYTLAPEATIPDITLQIGQAISCAAGMVAGAIRLAGHSAGGHLVTRMICKDSPLEPEVTNRIKKVVSISGVHDLRPLRLAEMNDVLKLDEATVLAESPALLDPMPGKDVIAWVGAAERPEFLRQSALLAEAWGRMGLQTKLVADPGRHHFDVIDGLKDPDHPLTRTLIT
ncbi:MAG: alpha/beta fold hydrolase [Pseudomonadota bacterium]